MISIAETQALSSKIKTLKLCEIGNEQWSLQHEALEKIKIGAVQQSQQKHDEYIINELIVDNKISILIKNLIVIEIWKHKIYPYIVDNDQIKKNQALSTKLYMTVCSKT